MSNSEKFLMSIIPVCVTFGPIFMTGVFRSGHWVEAAGSLLLALGGAGLVRIITKQQVAIRALEVRLGGVI